MIGILRTTSATILKKKSAEGAQYGSLGEFRTNSSLQSKGSKLEAVSAWFLPLNTLSRQLLIGGKQSEHLSPL